MLLQNLLLRQTPLISFFLFKQKSLHIPAQTTSLFTSYSPLAPRSFLPSRSSVGALFSSEALLELPPTDEIEAEDRGFGVEREEFVPAGVTRVLVTDNKESRPNFPNLSVKEKKELASYAHSLGKKLKSQQVGKSGVTDTVIMALGETLEANELLKVLSLIQSLSYQPVISIYVFLRLLLQLKIHNNCPGELDDVVKQLEDGTGSLVVGRIGRTVILYRPSLTKMKLEEKKKQAHMVLQKKQATMKHFQVPIFYHLFLLIVERFTSLYYLTLSL